MGREGSAVNLVIKYVLFFFNFAICLVAAAVTSLMIWILVEKEKTVKNAYDFFLDPSCVLCLAGCVAVSASLFGWYGALRESMLSLKIYRFQMLIWFIVEMAAIILIFVVVYVPEARQQLGIYPEDSLKRAIDLYRDDADMQDLIDGIQEGLECCGTSNDDVGYLDWSRNAYFNCTDGTTTYTFGEFCAVPFSCCIKEDNGLVNYACGKDMQRTDMDPNTRLKTIYTRGCFKAITSILESNVLIVGGVIIGILIPQMFLTAITGNLMTQIQIQMSKWNRQPRPMRP